MSFRIIPSIFLYDGKVVDKKTNELIGDGDAISLATLYNNQGADELIIFDNSDSDKLHEKNISTIISIADAVDIPILVGGNIATLEDIRKFIYAGAKKVILDGMNEVVLKMIPDAADKFGSDKIAVMINDNFDMNKIKSLKYDGASLIVANNCAESALGYGIKVMAYDCMYSFEEIINFAKQERVYGVSHGGLDYKFDYMNFKEQLKAENIKVFVFDSKISFEKFKLNSDGMLPVIVQDYKTDKILMLAYMNEEAFNLTIKTGKMTYFSRSRNEIWVKGLTSGHFQYVKELTIDCDLDTILAKVHQIGVPCHTGAETCFFNELVKKEYDESNPIHVFEKVYNKIVDRKVNPKEGSYTTYLFDKGVDKILKKVGEEATEIVIAGKNPDPHEIKYEISDFLYHMMVLMAEKGVTWKEITKELSKR